MIYVFGIVLFMVICNRPRDATHHKYVSGHPDLPLEILPSERSKKLPIFNRNRIMDLEGWFDKYRIPKALHGAPSVFNNA